MSPGKHRRTVIAATGSMTRGAVVLEYRFASLDSGSFLSEADTDGRGQKHAGRYDSGEHYARRPRKCRGQIPPRPGARMPLGSTASLIVSLKRRST